MPKTAVDAFFGTNAEPISAGRHAGVIGSAGFPLATDLPYVSSSLLVTCATAGTVTVIMANDPDFATTVIPISPGMIQLQIQVRQVVGFSLGTGGGVVALWS